MRTLAILTLAALFVRGEEGDVLAQGPAAEASAARTALEALGGKRLSAKQVRKVAGLLRHADESVRQQAGLLVVKTRAHWKAALEGLAGDGCDNAEAATVLVGMALHRYVPFHVAVREMGPEIDEVMKRVVLTLGEKNLPRYAGAQDPSMYVRFIPPRFEDKLFAMLAERIKEDDKDGVARAVAMLAKDPATVAAIVRRRIERPHARFLDKELLKQLARFGSRARDVAPDLRAWLPRASGNMTLPVAIALRALGEDIAVELCTIAGRLSALRADRLPPTKRLHELGAAGRPLCGVLIGRGRPGGRWSAPWLRAAHAFGYDEALVPRMRLWLRTGDPHAQQIALLALHGLDAPAEALDDVRRLLKSPHELLRTAAQRLLDKAAKRDGG